MKHLNERQRQIGKWVGGAAVGALAMYLFDPQRGGARRSLSGEKLRGLTRQGGAALGSAWHDIGSRLGHAGSAVKGAVDSGVEAVERGMGAVDKRIEDVPARQAFEQVQQLAADLRARSPLRVTAAGSKKLARRAPVAIGLGLLGMALLARGSRKPARPAITDQQREQGDVEQPPPRPEMARREPPPQAGASGQVLH